MNSCCIFLFCFVILIFVCMDLQQQQLLFGNGDGGGDDSCGKTSVSDSSKVIKRIDNMRDTIYSLEKSFDVSRCLEAGQWSRFHRMKMRNVKLSKNLKEVEQGNTTMLNLFRADVTDELPETLKNKVRRSWQQKYDALLIMNNKLRREIHLKDIIIKEKNYEIAVLQQQLLNIGEKLMEQNQVIKNINNKYLILKRRKDKQKVFLTGSIDTLQDSSSDMKSNNVNIISKLSQMSLMPNQKALLTYEIQRCDRLIRENGILRDELQQSCTNCKCNHSSDEISNV